MQFKYIAVALSSLLISGVKAAPMPNPEVRFPSSTASRSRKLQTDAPSQALENIEGNELIARSEQAKQAKQIGGPGGLDQFNGPGTSLMGLGNNNNGIGGNNYIDPSLLYGGGGGGNRFNPVSLYGGGGGGIPCNQCGGEQTGYCQWVSTLESAPLSSKTSADICTI